MGRTSDARDRLMVAVMELIWTGSYGSTTVDQICERAGVNKGSIYHFFESKSHLAETALIQEWNLLKPKYDSMFSVLVPPLDRIKRMCDDFFTEQIALKELHGSFLGCPLCSLGSEISTLDLKLKATILEILDQIKLYLESAIRDADRSGAIQVKDPGKKAKILFAYVEGVLAQARIYDDARILEDLWPGTLDILGVSTAAASGKIA